MATLRLTLVDPSINDVARFVEVLDSLSVSGGRKVTVETEHYSSHGTNYTRELVKVSVEMSSIAIRGEDQTAAEMFEGLR